MDVNPKVAELLESISARLSLVAADVAPEIRASMEQVSPSLRGDASISAMMEAATTEAMATVLHSLRFGIDLSRAEVPQVALEYGRRLAQRDVPAATLIRAYRQGEVHFLRWCIEDLLEVATGGQGDVLMAALTIFEMVTAYVDKALGVTLTAYEEDRERWSQYKSALAASRINDLLSVDDKDGHQFEASLDYRLSCFHVGLVLCLNGAGDQNPLILLERALEEIAGTDGFTGEHLFLPCDNAIAWAWLSSKDGSALDAGHLDSILARHDPGITAALGRPEKGVAGFRRTHEQAVTAQMVASAAAPAPSRVTPFESVAPIAMMCSDLSATRRWVVDALGGLAVNSERNSMLRDTARAFLDTDGSYIATAKHLAIHRNTAQYRIRKAEEVRGRSLRDSRLDLELALLTCHWLGETVLQPG